MFAFFYIYIQTCNHDIKYRCIHLYITRKQKKANQQSEDIAQRELKLSLQTTIAFVFSIVSWLSLSDILVILPVGRKWRRSVIKLEVNGHQSLMLLAISRVNETQPICRCQPPNFTSLLWMDGHPTRLLWMKLLLNPCSFKKNTEILELGKLYCFILFF